MEETDDELTLFETHQLSLLYVLFREMGHRKLLDGRLGQIFLKSFTKYIKLMEKQGSILDLPFIYS